jgi:hypothetical protein
MIDSDKPRFQEQLTAVMSFYERDVSHLVLSVWWGACAPFDLEQVTKAFTSHATDPDRGQFPPKPADIVRILGGTSTDRAALAWGKALEAASTIGAYTDVVFDDPAIHASIEDVGGWVKFCRTETAELSYLQHRFTESYRAYCRLTEYGYPRVLVGARSSDESFRMRGIEPPKPVPIGDRQKARNVYRLGGKSKSSTSIGVQSAQSQSIADSIKVQIGIT